MKSQRAEIANLDFPCALAVKRLKNLPGFQLYVEEEFTLLVYRRCLQENLQSAEAFRSAALNVYAEGLYLAVSAKDGLSRQALGFQELSKYLYRMAYNFFLRQAMDFDEVTEKAQECTQIALERIYAHLDDVRSPGGFLKWCGVILRNCCLEDVKGWKRELRADSEDFENEITGNNDDTSLDSEVDRNCLLAAILRLKKEYQTVIRLSYFSQEDRGKKASDEAIANRLNITVGNLYTLRSRALSALRKDKKLLECLQGTL